MEQRKDQAQRLSAGHDRFLSDVRGVHFYDWQREWRDELYRAVIVRDFTELYLEVARQSGKTTSVVESVAYLLSFADLIFGKPFNVGFFAPRKEQAKTDWDRVKEVMPVIADLFGLRAVEENANTMTWMRPRITHRTKLITRWDRAATMFSFSLGETTKLESKTLDLAICEEAHEIDERKFEKEARPMLASTNGVACFIGVAGYRLCNFKRGVEESKHSFIIPVSKIIESRRRAYEETGDRLHLAYEEFYKGVLKKIGNVPTDEIKTQYILEWVTERGNFVNKTQLNKCRKEEMPENVTDVIVGIDFGKHTDPTVVTVCSYLGQRLRSMELLGSNYTVQIPVIIQWLQEEFEDKGMRILVVRCDATGVGDVVVEMLEQQCRWNVEPFIFTQLSKALIFQTLTNLIAVSEGIADGSVADTGQRRFEYWAGDPMVEKFEQEMLDLEKEYVGEKQILSCHAPDKSGCHDDYCCSAALAVSYERNTMSMSL